MTLHRNVAEARCVTIVAKGLKVNCFRLLRTVQKTSLNVILFSLLEICLRGVLKVLVAVEL